MHPYDKKQDWNQTIIYISSSHYQFWIFCIPSPNCFQFFFPYNLKKKIKCTRTGFIQRNGYDNLIVKIMWFKVSKICVKFYHPFNVHDTYRLEFSIFINNDLKPVQLTMGQGHVKLQIISNLWWKKNFQCFYIKKI